MQEAIGSWLVVYVAICLYICHCIYRTEVFDIGILMVVILAGFKDVLCMKLVLECARTIGSWLLVNVAICLLCHCTYYTGLCV